MSSDGSTIANILASLNLTELMQTNVPKPENWAIRLIGNFMLNLYHRSIITPKDDWQIKKSELCEEYSQNVTTEKRRKLKEICGSDNIETLLHRYGFLLNTARTSLSYKIKCKTLFDFRKQKINELDKKRINGTKTPLEYQGSIIQLRKNNFRPTSMSCYICQENLTTKESLEEHIQIHNEDKDLEFLTKIRKINSPIFTISYETCTISNKFLFNFKISLENLTIEKIIIVQSRSCFYVLNEHVPYKFPDKGTDCFSVDSNLFARHVEQPIILICYLEHSKDSRIIEQHNFMHSGEIPKVNLPKNPYRLPDQKKFKPIFELADYIPPKEIQDALKDDFYYEKLMMLSHAFRNYVCGGKDLQPQTIGASLRILLQIEDVDTIREYLSLRQTNVKLCSCGDEYSFELEPNQSAFLEDKLSVYDDVILTTRTDILTKTEELLQLMMQNQSDIHRIQNTFLGHIQDVNKGHISFKCNKKIDIRASYTVICRPSRLNFRYQYRSLELLPANIDFLKKLLFPANLISMPLSTISLNLYNKNITAEQLQAVRNIAQGPRKDATYIIFGPPGTGKTTTLVESILQILRKPDTKILVTASSNSACDEVALRLCKYLKQLDIKRAMVRIYSRSSQVRANTIDDELLEYSNMYDGQFFPDVEILHEYRVVICTLSIVAKLATGNFGCTLYTHLFIDEVAASMEVEALMAITTVLTPKSCLIISGDHKQLGPILQSKRAKELGLDVSLMDRLLARDCYRVDVDTGDYDRTIQTRLVRNYRSHPAIVNLYSYLYYSQTLEACAKPDDVALCKIWHKSRNKQYPILFHAIYEPSKSDIRSPSLHNFKELYLVMDYVKDLMYFGINGKPVKESDIGIISPYKGQFRRIQEELNLRKWFGIETGSVETFQGKEKDIIIVSFVRSGTETLGFLDNPRRLNVALSRAKSLLILIGNPKTLSLSSDFEYIIEECQSNNTFIGENSPSPGDINKQEKRTQLHKKMQALSVGNENEDDDVFDKIQYNGNRKPIRSALATKNVNAKANLKIGNDMQKPNKIVLSKRSTHTAITYTKEQLLELQHQQNYLNLQQKQWQSFNNVVKSPVASGNTPNTSVINSVNKSATRSYNNINSSASSSNMARPIVSTTLNRPISNTQSYDYFDNMLMNAPSNPKKKSSCVIL